MLMDRVIMERLGAAISGVARGPSGDWLFRFKMAIRVTYTSQIEGRAILKELAAVSNVFEIQMINDLCFRDWQVKFKKIRRTNNKVVDRLAKTISDNIDRLVVLEDLPSEINILLEEDICLTVLVES
ncbi:hypothetical protein Gohar_025159, partial [Gossypium harknessii]|nr:hypothetical protein [Gossypium harknessii]